MSSLFDANQGLLGVRQSKPTRSRKLREKMRNITEKDSKFKKEAWNLDFHDRDEINKTATSPRLLLIKFLRPRRDVFPPFLGNFETKAHPKWTGLVVCGILFYFFQRESISGEGKGRGGIDVSALIKKKKTVVTGGSSSRHTSNWVGGSGGNNILKSKAKRHKKRRVGDSASSVARGHTSCCCCLLSR